MNPHIVPRHWPSTDYWERAFLGYREEDWGGSLLFSVWCEWMCHVHYCWCLKDLIPAVSLLVITTHGAAVRGVNKVTVFRTLGIDMKASSFTQEGSEEIWKPHLLHRKVVMSSEYGNPGDGFDKTLLFVILLSLERCCYGEISSHPRLRMRQNWSGPQTSLQ